MWNVSLFFIFLFFFFRWNSPLSQKIQIKTKTTKEKKFLPVLKPFGSNLNKNNHLLLVNTKVLLFSDEEQGRNKSNILCKSSKLQKNISLLLNR